VSYKFLKGEPLSLCQHVNYCQIAKDLAQFLQELESISIEGGPKAGLHSFFRGGDLSVYAEQTAKAIKALHQTIEAEKALHLWKEAVKHPWKQKDVWVHGDISPGNLLALHGKLVAVIDFGQLCCGDPACDLVIAWTLFPKESRKVFFENLHFDEHTLLRAKAWALWKALIVAAGFTKPDNIEAKKCLEIINLLLTE